MEHIRTKYSSWRHCLVDTRQCQEVSLQDVTRCVLEYYPGKGGIVRSALIKTGNGPLKRPVVKLALLFEKHFHNENGAGIVGASIEI